LPWQNRRRRRSRRRQSAQSSRNLIEGVQPIRRRRARARWRRLYCRTLYCTVYMQSAMSIVRIKKRNGESATQLMLPFHEEAFYAENSSSPSAGSSIGYAKEGRRKEGLQDFSCMHTVRRTLCRTFLVPQRSRTVHPTGYCTSTVAMPR
jgi:hypothetical protein